MITKIKQIVANTYVDPFSVAIVYIGLGEKGEAFTWLQKELPERFESMIYYKDAPILDSLRADSLFTALLRGMNLAP